MFFGIYSRSAPVRLAPAWLDGREGIAVREDPDDLRVAGCRRGGA
jgi:hypothetical protein